MKITSINSSSGGCCYIIESGGQQLIIECGIPFKKITKALNFDFSRLVGCLISHEHTDHCLAIQQIDRQMSIPIYGPLGLNKDLSLYKYSAIDAGSLCHCGDFRIMPTTMEHDVLCFGYMIQAGPDTLFYATDTASVNYQVAGLTHLMIEANHSISALMKSDANKARIARAADNHLSIDQAIEFAVRHKETLQEVHLLHLSDEHSDEKLFKKMMQEAVGVPVYVAEK